MKIAIKRVYEPYEESDGYRVLVDRLWPRGLTKARVHYDEWAKFLAPSTELRKAFGHDPSHWATFQEKYVAAVSYTHLDVYKRQAIEGDTRTVTLTVHEGPDKPYLSSGRAYRRTDTSTVEVSRLEYGRLVLTGEHVSFDALVAKEQDLAFGHLEKELASKLGLKPLDQNSLISLELMTPSGEYCNAAALLADSNHFPGIDIARFGESINIINARHTFEHMSVLEQMQRTLEVFDTYYAYEEIVGFERIAKTLVPREAFREAIANALVHRCWDVRANIKVGMFADRIEITSPGGLPAGITEELYLAGGPSVARNPDVYKRQR